MVLPNYLSHFIPFAKRIGLAFLIFSLCRIFFYVFNASHFTAVSIWDFIYGVRFDAVAIAYLYSPFILMSALPFSFRSFRKYQRTLAILFYISNTIAIILNLIDVAYYDFTQKRTTTDLFSMIGAGGGQDFLTLLPRYVIDFWYDYVLLAFLIWLSWYIYKKYCRFKGFFYPYEKKNYFIQSGIFVVIGAFTLLAMRGGFQLRPLNIVSAGQYTHAQNVSLVLNTPFTVLKSLTKEQLKPLNYFDEETLNAIYQPEISLNEEGSKPNNKNVVFIIIESLAKEYVGYYNNGKGYTPFIDSLMQDSYVFENAYANGQKSIESLPSILASLPQLTTTPLVVSSYANNKIDGLPKILNKNGYHTSFYHAGSNGTMGFDAFSKMAGTSYYFGLNEYPKKDQHYDGKWGIFDEPYFQYFAEELNQHPMPFFSTIFTISSHHPYTIPNEHTGKFPKGTLPMHEVVGYTDYSLKKFFEKAQTMKWFSNTLFVVTADHSTQSEQAKYNTPTGRFAIPLFIFDATKNLTGKYTPLSQQIDIAPSIVSLLGIPTKSVAFGRSVFEDSTKNPFVINYINGVYQLMQKEYVLLFDGKNSIGFYNLQEDELMLNNLIKTNLDETQNKQLSEMEKLVKAIIQQYNNRLINNQLSVSE